MAYSRGYHSYRGRTPKWRVVLAVFLVAVILAAIGVMLLSKNIVYDEDGTPKIELPWQEPAQPEEEAPALDLTIETPKAAAAAPQAFLLPSPLTSPLFEQEKERYGGGCTSIAVTMKDDAGAVYFNSTAALPGTVKFDPAENGEALKTALAWAKEQSGHAIARIACFHDSKAANSDVEGMGLKNTGGYIFYDGNNTQWLDPGKTKAREYLKSIIREAAEQGFDEILLTGVSYPTAGKLDKIDLSYAKGAGDGGDGRGANLAAFLQEVRGVLPEGVKLSLELDGDTIRDGAAVHAGGQALDQLAPLVDRIYAVCTAEEAPGLQTAVQAASPSCGFVPELSAADKTLASFLVVHP